MLSIAQARRTASVLQQIGPIAMPFVAVLYAALHRRLVWPYFTDTVLHQDSPSNIHAQCNFIIFDIGFHICGAFGLHHFLFK